MSARPLLVAPAMLAAGVGPACSQPGATAAARASPASIASPGGEGGIGFDEGFASSSATRWPDSSSS